MRIWATKIFEERSSDNGKLLSNGTSQDLVAKDSGYPTTKDVGGLRRLLSYVGHVRQQTSKMRRRYDDLTCTNITEIYLLNNGIDNFQSVKDLAVLLVIQTQTSVICSKLQAPNDYQHRSCPQKRKEIRDNHLYFPPERSHSYMTTNPVSSPA